MLTAAEQDNLDEAAPLAMDSEKSTQVPAVISLAQWALESGWGTKMPPGSNNPFGIKAVDGQPFVAVLTDEFIEGVEVTVPQHFRLFPSLAEAFTDHADLLATGTYYHEAFGKYLQNRDVNAFIDALAVHYSTSPTYATELRAMTVNEHITAALAIVAD
jgi:flagellum-specific peptidoglycan hydrolase FlgJ